MTLARGMEPLRGNLKKVFEHWEEQDGLCWYCGTKCFLNLERYALGDQDQPDNLATLEHLFSRVRQRANPNVRVDYRKNPARLGNTTVMACRECNRAKGKWTFLLNRSNGRMERPSGNNQTA